MMVGREEKVLLSEDRLGRVAIVKRNDGHFCLYAHWRWSVEVQRAFRVQNAQDIRWTTDYDPALYYDSTHDIEVKPEPGIYGSMEEAEREARVLLGLDSD